MVRFSNSSMDSNPWIIKSKLIEISWLIKTICKWFKLIILRILIPWIPILWIPILWIPILWIDSQGKLKPVLAQEAFYPGFPDPTYAFPKLMN